MELIDLHTHTTASDGTLAPAELVRAAHRAGLRALAVTDHDTTSGLAEALAEGEKLGLEVIPGVEITAEVGLRHSVHILGLFLDPEDEGLKEGLGRFMASRKERNPKIVAKLNELGIDITLDQVKSYAGGELISRAHFAQALVGRGAAATRQEAFNRYIGAGRPAYVPKLRLPLSETAGLIKGAGGVPVLAHPGIIELPPPALEALITRLAGEGLEGVEAYYSEHGAAMQRRLIALAARLGLVVTGGSDFHGGCKPDVRLAYGRGELRVPAGILSAIKQRRDRIRKEAR